jgi:ATP-dependent protease Clp ATPase subunit
MSDENIFLISWDMHGVESVINVTEIDKEVTWAVLQDSQPARSLGTIINAVMLRARYNSQRHYEVYTITVEESITEADIREMFERDPQGSADLIRARGRKMYSDRVDQNIVKIV